MKSIKLLFLKDKFIAMKKYFLVIASLLLVLIARSQIEIGDTTDFKEFFSTTTYFVKDANLFSDFNYYIKDAAKQAWTITPYKIITYEEYKKMPLTKGKSFVMTTTVFPEKNPQLKYDFLTVLMGGEGSKLGSKGGSMPILAAIPLSFHGDDENYYDYKLVPFLYFLQKHIKIASQNPEYTQRDYLRLYNKNARKLKNKTLVLSQDQIPDNFDVTKYYHGRVKIMPQEEIAKLIKAGDTTIVFAHIVAAPTDDEIIPQSYCYKMLFDAKGTLYYFAWHKMNNSQLNVLLKQDFIKLDKKIRK